MSQASSGSWTRGAGIWLRWSWRDLRSRWLQVFAIALVIALGTGSYAGLLSLTEWRRISSDKAYEQLQMYDLRVELAQSLTADEGQLLTIARSIDGAEAIEMAEERLIAEVQVDASTAAQTILVQGLLYGLDLTDGGPDVNKLYAVEGRDLDEGDQGDLNVALEHNFGKHYSLPPAGELRISGGQSLSYVGQVLTPEYFLVTTEQGGLLAEANFAAVFASLETVQRLTDQPGKVNDLVLTLSEGADVVEIQEALQAAFDSESVGASVMTRDDDPSFRLNDRDIEGDRQTFQILALLVFGGAVGAAFNLSARIVDSQRREIGIAMALGLPPWRIAIRPMLVGAQVALLGVMFGLGVGYLIGQAMFSLATDLLPLPEWQTSFQFRLFGIVATVGFLLPLFATAWPVWRAVRVSPIETIRPAYRSRRGGGLAPLVRRLRLPGNTLQQAPFRNIVRSPRRTLLTSLGIAAALAALVSFIGMIDSFIATTDRGDAEILGQAPQRIEVRLTGFVSSEGEVVRGIASLPVVEAAEPGVLIVGRIQAGENSVDMQLELLRASIATSGARA